MTDVNGLPLEIFIALCGIGIVLLAWFLVRFGSKIAKFLMVCAGVGIGGIVAVSLAVQSGANFEQSRATVEVAKVAQVANSSNLVLIAFTGCIAGIALVSIVALAGVAVFLWYKLQLEGKRHRGYPPVVQVAPHGQPARVAAGDFDLAWIQDENWQEQGEELWTQNESLFW